ncbi:MAG: tRNA (adenosine(37)-N6)-threonylcarbamoyltransferase complex dimerization subunit type 1 TsaB [Candidatus Omnitrophica bacterium]|nr:tRNA (adenosine(37)-N6)-threonylcarbamoyltransferase complex dimerization subunit type 1 TsaB [Candidatus Omnitrophota bacterium]
MRVLGIETSNPILSAALLDGNEIIAERAEETGMKHSSHLVPMIDEILKKCDLSLNEIDGIAVSNGPGSFTGLRVGVTTAKALAIAVNKPLVAVSSLIVLAESVSCVDEKICTLIDAKRNRVYIALFVWERNKLKRLVKDSLMLIDDIHKIKELSGKVLFIGDGAGLYKDKIQDCAKVKVLFPEKLLNYPQAGFVAKLGLAALKKGKHSDPYKLTPTYLYPKTCSIKKRQKK